VSMLRNKIASSIGEFISNHDVESKIYEIMEEDVDEKSMERGIVLYVSSALFYHIREIESDLVIGIKTVFHGIFLDDPNIHKILPGPIQKKAVLKELKK
jgi:hypothetical protein